MAPAGRPRRRAENLPAHIDLDRLPAGIWWHAQRRCWIQRKAGKMTRIAGPDAKMSELYAIAEAAKGEPVGTLQWLGKQFLADPKVQAKAKGTRKDYEYSASVLCAVKLRDGRTAGDLLASGITRPMVQRILDKIAAGTDGKPTPSKAQHVRRYLSRLYFWAMARGHVPTVENPAANIEMLAEKPRRRLPSHEAVRAVIRFARTRGALAAHTKGSVPPYLWAIVVLAYACRLRGAELCDLTDAHASKAGLISDRRKGSRDTLNPWTPALREAWQALADYRTARQVAHARPVSLRPENRQLLVAEDGFALTKSALDSAWQRMIKAAIAEKVITAADRFSPHDLKRLGVTDTPGTRHDKLQAAGHRSEKMGDVYDLSLPVAGEVGAELFTELFTQPEEDNKKGA